MGNELGRGDGQPAVEVIQHPGLLLAVVAVGVLHEGDIALRYQGNGRCRVSIWQKPGPACGGSRSCWFMLIGMTSLRRESVSMEVRPGRYTADIEGDFVVFLIGMRFNHPLRVRKWLPVATAMPKMLKVLSRHPELGCLGFQQWFGRTTVLVQYWRDFDSLDRFARDKDLPHLEPWRQFNRAVRDSGEVGIWHETFRVRAGEYEAVYGNMPVFGLAAAGIARARRPQGQHGSGTHRRQHHRRAGRRAVLTAISRHGHR